ncbi:MAG: right-handed parallel beta-helix repeat-containing protein [Phycisphaeraceae bacterium]|nr:right-handed parallel beta-helix repeat-containing protein [Phycisphaerae bacterium]MBX3391852.1 right-handed parallel beta-helix repeat-containing protein [Phycisphaeraceae bacterium]
MKRLIERVVGRCGLVLARPVASAPRRARPEMFDRLEPRTLLATFLVTNLNDSGAGSLRQAILDANGIAGADVIEFNTPVAGTITLTSGELVVTESLSILGPGAGVVSLDGNGASRVLRYESGTSSISGLRIIGGQAFNGGAIRNAGTLTVSNSTIANNQSSAGGGGGIDNTGVLTITNSTIGGNNAGIGDGGGIRNSGSVTIINSTISGNQAVGGGALANFGPSMVIRNSTIAQNSATADGSGILNFNAVTINNSTIANNTGAPVFTSSGNLILRSSIVAGVPSGPMVGVFATGSTHNLIQDALNAGGLVNGVEDNLVGADPLLGPLADNGGGTFTLAIQTGSPAINAGRSSEGLATDQRGAGFPRLRGTRIDIGSFEFSAPPVIGALGVSTANVIRGQSVILTATNVTDPDGTVSRVNFFHDLNRNGLPDEGELIGFDEDPDGGFTFTYAVPNDAAMGPADLLALAIDNDVLSGPVVSAGVVILSDSPFASAPGQLLGASGGSAGNVNVTTTNPSGRPIVVQQAPSATNWTASDLLDKTGGPTIVGEVITWVDPKDGLTYAAAMTAEGLGLFTNTSGANWTFRNLGTEVTGAPLITSNLTVFTATDQTVNIAGVADGGDLIRFFQTGSGGPGAYGWSFFNHGDDLRSQGLTAPVFAGRITSFVTPWNALNVVGLDAAGQIQAIWWHQSLQTQGRWTTNNLSAETGAPALTGGLTVWLTSWNAINIAGTDNDGKLSATWWVPGFNEERWNNSNLTDIIGGPILQADSMTSWVTPWGAMNIAGRESNGTMSAYWWVPGFNNDQWQVARFADVVPGASITSGPVTGLTAQGGSFSMSILSTSPGGEVVRLWWSPETNAWAEENLTAVAQPI